MKAHLIAPAFISVFLMLTALSTGSPVFVYLLFVIVCSLVLSFAGVLWVSRTIVFSVDMPCSAVRRGDDIIMTLSVRHHGLLPVAPILLTFSPLPGLPEREIRLRNIPGKLQTLNIPFHASHIGTSSPGLRSCTIEDLLGIFSVTKKVDRTLHDLLVLPNVFRTDPMAASPGDSGSETVSRATEDLSEPSDIRTYQPGDPMKKIHWKLSVRKQELMVRKFDEPVRQGVLILLDCSRPPSWGQPEAEADIRDALVETAASVFTDQCRTDRSVRLPLNGAHPIDIDKSMGPSLSLENLARADFTKTDRFERVLSLESGRLRKIGCLFVISARLNSAMVDIMIRMHRTGPNIRLYLVTFAPDDPNVLVLIARLKQSGIQVSYVTPAVN